MNIISLLSRVMLWYMLSITLILFSVSLCIYLAGISLLFSNCTFSQIVIVSQTITNTNKWLFVTDKKSLNIPNEQSESISRRTDNTMAKRQKDRQHNGQKKKDKRTKKNDLQNITQKTKDRATRTPPKGGVELRCFINVFFINVYACMFFNYAI